MSRLVAPAPPARLAVLRLLVGGFALAWVVGRAPHLVSFRHFDAVRFEPVGIATALTGPLAGGVLIGLVLATMAAGVAYVAGWRFRLTGPAFAVLLLAVTTYRNSWGQVFHTDNLVVLHVAVVALAPAADVLSVDARRRGGEAPAAGPDYGWAVRVCAVLTVATYFIAGWAKLRNAGFDWVTGETLRNQVAFDNVRKAALGDGHSGIGAYAVRHGWLFPPLAVVTIAVELAAPLVLLAGQRVRALWVALAWLFHVGIVALMAITFPYPLVGVAFAPLFRLERLAEGRRYHRLPWRRPSRSTTSTAPPSGSPGSPTARRS